MRYVNCFAGFKRREMRDCTMVNKKYLTSSPTSIDRPQGVSPWHSESNCEATPAQPGNNERAYAIAIR